MQTDLEELVHPANAWVKKRAGALHIGAAGVDPKSTEPPELNL